MRAKYLKAKYRGFWKNVEINMMISLGEIRINGLRMPIEYARSQAHNAAFFATLEHHRALKSIKK